MRLLDETNLADYLRDTGRIGPNESVVVRELSGGVSNVVYSVSCPDVPDRDFVLKQAREQLRTTAAWFCTVERIWREIDVLQVCAELLERTPTEPLVAVTPRVLFEDRENFCFAMTAAPMNHRVWKRDLLEGRVDLDIGAACGKLLGKLHAGSWLDPKIARELGDRTIFDELRTDPFYRTVARAYPDLEQPIGRLIDSVRQHAICLVHADFSPKNLLVFEGGLMMVDFETGHFGDPAFDLGFFLSHLALKAFRHRPHDRPYWELSKKFLSEYQRELRAVVAPLDLQLLMRRAMQNFGGCVLSRLAGKSPVNYLDEPVRREQLVRLCRWCFLERPDGWSEVCAVIAPT